MSQYQFKINDRVIKHPTNWAGMSLGYSFDGTKSGAKEISQIIFCDAETRAEFLAQVEAVPCFEYIFSISFRCKTNDPWQEIFFTTIRLRDLQYMCSACEMQLPSKRNSVASYLDEISSDEKCVKTQVDLDLFQFQSGGTYFTDDREIVTGPFVSILDLVNLFAQDTASPNFTNLTGLVDNESALYMPSVITIAPDSVPGDTTELIIVGEFKQTFTITIETGSASIEEYLNRISQALLIMPDSVNIFMNSVEFHSRIAYTEIENDILKIYSYWDVESVDLEVGGVVPGWYVENITPQRKSSADLYISPAGLFGDEVCLSWGELRDLILKLQGGFIKESFNSEDFTFQPYCSILEDFPATSPASDTLSNANNIRRSFNSSWFVNKVAAGYDFRLEDFNEDSSEDRWEWWGKTIYGSVFSNQNCITFTEECFGRPFGRYIFSNNGTVQEHAVINIYVDNANTGSLILVDSRTVPVAPNISVEVNIDTSFPAIQDQRFRVGDKICVEWLTESDANGISTGPHIFAEPESYWMFICTHCESTPFLNEDDIYTESEFGNLTDFAGCTGTRKETVPAKFYAGLGFAYAQKLQGLKDYDDTHFITYRDGDGRARRFPKSFYFQSTYINVCEQYRGNFISFEYYNAPLQLPHLLQDLLCRVPSGVSIPSYDFVATVGPGGYIDFSKTSTLKEMNGTGKKSYLELDICSKEYDLVRALQYGAINIDLCGIEGTGIIENFEMVIGGDRKGKYRILI